MTEITPVIMPSVGHVAKKLNHSYTAGDNVQWYKHSISHTHTHTNLNMKLPFDLAIKILSIYPRDMKICFHIKTST